MNQGRDNTIIEDTEDTSTEIAMENMNQGRDNTIIEDTEDTSIENNDIKELVPERNICSNLWSIVTKIFS